MVIEREEISPRSGLNKNSPTFSSHVKTVSRRIHEASPQVEIVNTLPVILETTFIHFTPREREVLQFMAIGFTDSEIGRKLEISEYTVNNYVSGKHRNRGILGKLNAINRTHAVIKGGKLGVIELTTYPRTLAEEDLFTLSRRMREIIDIMVDGYGEYSSPKDIAWRLGISHNTVKNYLTNVFTRLGLRTREEVALAYLKYLNSKEGGVIEEGRLRLQDSTKIEAVESVLSDSSVQPEDILRRYKRTIALLSSAEIELLRETIAAVKADPKEYYVILAARSIEAGWAVDVLREKLGVPSLEDACIYFLAYQKLLNDAATHVRGEG